MYTVYVLRSAQTGHCYTGYTENMLERLKKHNAGEVISTKALRPWRLIYCECYVNKGDAMRREKYLKTTAGKRALKLMLRRTLREVSSGVAPVQLESHHLAVDGFVP